MHKRRLLSNFGTGSALAQDSADYVAGLTIQVSGLSHGTYYARLTGRGEHLRGMQHFRRSLFRWLNVQKNYGQHNCGLFQSVLHACIAPFLYLYLGVAMS